LAALKPVFAAVHHAAYVASRAARFRVDNRAEAAARSERRPAESCTVHPRVRFSMQRMSRCKPELSAGTGFLGQAECSRRGGVLWPVWAVLPEIVTGFCAEYRRRGRDFT